MVTVELSSNVKIVARRTPCTLLRWRYPAYVASAVTDQYD
jgi:hypothetical protein